MARRRAYLAARCLIRAGQFAEAETELRSVAADPALTRWHAPAGRLLDYVEAHLHPAERMHQLALALVRPDSEATIGQDLIDYRMLFDRNIAPQPNDDLADWIPQLPGRWCWRRREMARRHTLPWRWPPSQLRSLVTPTCPSFWPRPAR